MKRYFKITLLIALLFTGLFLTQKVNAAETTKSAKVEYGKATTSGVPITLTFSQELKDITLGDGWAISGKTATKTMKQGSIYACEVWFKDGITEEAKVAVPIELKVGETLDMSGIGKDPKKFSVSDTTIATVSGTKITAEKAGTTTLKGTCQIDTNSSYSFGYVNTIASVDPHYMDFDFTWDLTVIDDNSNGDMELTNFNNAKYSWDSTINDPKLIVSNVTPISKHSYKYAITNNATSAPSVSNNTDYLNKSDNNLITRGLGDHIALNQDLYLWVWESDYKNEELVVKGVKIEKPEIPKYAKAFVDTSTRLTAAAYETGWFNISLLYPFGDLQKQGRKINFKIGKITDNTILSKIHNNESDGWASLLEYAKSANTITDKTVVSNRFNGYDTIDANNELGISRNSLEKDAYYFIYADLDDEDGKYLSAEAVTLAVNKGVYDQTSTEDNFYFLEFYGSESFNWENFDDSNESEDVQKEEQKDDKSKAPTRLPDTGEKAIIAIISLFGIVAIVTHLKLKNNYRDIK